MKKQIFGLMAITAVLVGGCATTKRADVADEAGYNAMVGNWTRRCENLASAGTPYTGADWGTNTGGAKADIDRDLYRMRYNSCRRSGI